MDHQCIICGSKRKKILLSKDNSLDYGVSEVIKVYASQEYIFAFFFSTDIILECQFTAYKYYLHI